MGSVNGHHRHFTPPTKPRTGRACDRYGVGKLEVGAWGRLFHCSTNLDRLDGNRCPIEPKPVAMGPMKSAAFILG